MPGLTYPYSIVAGDLPIANRVQANFDAIKTLLESTKLGQDNLQDNSVGIPQLAVDLDALLAGLGGNVGGNVSRGKSIKAGPGTTSSSSFADLSDGADSVGSVVLSTDGLLFVLFRALWKYSSGGSAGKAAVFLDANQVKGVRDPDVDGAPAVAAADLSSAGTKSAPLFTDPNSPQGMRAIEGTSVDQTLVTTGQFFGGYTSSDGGVSNHQGAWMPLILEANAGTYAVSVKYKNGGSGTLSVSERKLRVWAVGF